MRIFEITEAKKVVQPKAGDITPHDYNPSWGQLNSLKSDAQRTGNNMSGTYQLFIPRGIKMPSTSEVSKDLLKKPYAWDDEGNLKPEYERYYDRRDRDLHPTGKLNEAAPVLPPAKIPPIPGNNKPLGSGFWTSTAFKTGDKWTSDWNKWILGNMPQWSNSVGYLYKIKPGALILSLDYDTEATHLYNIFQDFGRVKDPDYGDKYGHDVKMRSAFPWNDISKHFDAVTHRYPYRDNTFMYGWDVESTVWFDTRFLQFVREVPVTNIDADWD